jgi:cob(I)alamin adenosyltransferase
MSRYYSGSGDDGTTGLLGEERVPKDHPLPETYGQLDEASAALGLARAFTVSQEADQALRLAQRDLYHIMAELAAGPEGGTRFQLLTPERLTWLEDQIARLGVGIEMPRDFVLGGDSQAGACLDLARAIVRRAERAVVRLAQQGWAGRPHLLAYLNRLSSLCFVLSLRENQLAGVERPTLAKNQEG